MTQNAEDADLIQQRFRILTPENSMKPQGIRPSKDQWTKINKHVGRIIWA